VWQREALRIFEASPHRDFLAVATPGAGKTTFALAAARRALLGRTISRVVVVVPTQHLKLQWAHAAEPAGIHLDPGWAAGYGALPSDVHGVVVTYQQVAANPGALRPLVRGAIAILDEIHHAGESRAWGDGVRFAFEHAHRRLCLSGTPFRSDQHVIPFVRYDGDLAQADYEYGYGEALKDQSVVRPVYFPRINGHMEWQAPDGLTYAATFDDRLTKDLASQRLRAALDAEGEWLSAVLTQAHHQLMHLRQGDPRAGGLVIAVDQEHARAIAGMIKERLGVSATIATSDDPSASDNIAAFAQSTTPWIVAVRMVSEGVDIPRLRVGVYATNTITELFFRQAVGRLVRWSGAGQRQTAYMFIPDDIRLRTFAQKVAEQRQHSLRKRTDDEDQGFGGDERDPVVEADMSELLDDPQLSLFSVISAVPLDEHGRPLEATRVYDDGSAPGEGAVAEALPDWYGNAQASGALPPSQGAWAPETSTIVPLPDPQPIAAAPQPAPSPLVKRRTLREQNNELVRELVHTSGKGHAEVNAELNRKIGIKRISEATVRQLEQRLELAKKLLKR